MAFPFYRQMNMMDCGSTCLRMIAKYYGKSYTAEGLRLKMGVSKAGTTLLSISETAEKIGFDCVGVNVTFDQLSKSPLPCIVHWDQNHFVVLISVSDKKIKVADPGEGLFNLRKEVFLAHWISNDAGTEKKGIALLLKPGNNFYKISNEKTKALSWSIVTKYLSRSKQQTLQVFLTLFIASGIQLLFPFLTQSIVDNGINAKNISLVSAILIAQLMLFCSESFISFVRSRLLLRISNLLNLELLSDFLIKLVKLPLSYFELHQSGDTLQRISDHSQIKGFLTGTAVNTLFSLFNFTIYAVVMVIYSVKLFVIFLIGSVFYFIWVRVFLGIRRKINYENFYLSSKENNATIQLVQGMQEIRLNNAENQKRWDWENIQGQVFSLNIKKLNYSQWQSIGASLISQIRNLTITFIVSELVITGSLTLGAMLAVQYILAQLSGPVDQLVSFVQSAQDAKISMERLNEIHYLPEEEDPDQTYYDSLPANKSIHLYDVSYKYPGAGNEPVLKNINLTIPEGKLTALVGVSGSGKTTLIKILQKIYNDYCGEIYIGKINASNADKNLPECEAVRFKDLKPSAWRQKCGSVMQDGFIFNDTIANNIVVGQKEIDRSRLVESAGLANALDFIDALPNGFSTIIGMQGIGLSQGQKQRILIARAIYKLPDYLFFDEATNALDSKNENEILKNLTGFFKGKTVIVAAHRLSTIKKADKIIVLEKGRIIEEGSHTRLLQLKGRYFELIESQLNPET